MSNPVSVKWFDSTMSGAPGMYGEAGRLIAVLDGCLINGFGSVNLDSIVVSSSVATGTLSTGHGFLDHAVVLIEKSPASDVDGEHRIVRVSDNVFTFDATGISDQTIYTIAAKMAPVGWSKTYSDTNKAAYSRNDLEATAMMLRVDDTSTRYPTLIMYESMGGIDTDLVGPSPTTGSYYCTKSTTENTTSRPWRLYADGCLLILNINSSTVWESGFLFGDCNSYVSSDAYHCLLMASSTQTGGATFATQFGTSSSNLVSRNYSQAGGAVVFMFYGHPKHSYMGYASGNIYPDPVTGGFHGSVIEITEVTSAGYRGKFAGMYDTGHSTGYPSDGTFITNVSELPGRVLRIQQTGNANHRFAVDLTGPWR